jgi:hypothetical protein
MFGFNTYAFYSNIDKKKLGYYRELQRKCKRKFGKQIFTISYNAYDIWGNPVRECVAIWVDKNHISDFHLMSSVFNFEKSYEKGVVKRISKEDFLKLDKYSRFVILYIESYVKVIPVVCQFMELNNDSVSWAEEVLEFLHKKDIKHIMSDGEFSSNGVKGYIYSIQPVTGYCLSIDYENNYFIISKIINNNKDGVQIEFERIPFNKNNIDRLSKQVNEMVDELNNNLN